MEPGAQTSTIGQLAKAAGLPVSTLRYYERRGLLEPQARTGSGYRVFGPASLERLRFIRSAQGFGFTLEDIEGLVRLRSESPDSCARVRRILGRRRREVEARLAELERLRELLSVSMDWCMGSGDGEGCRVLSELNARARGEEGTPVPNATRDARTVRELAEALEDGLAPLFSDARLFVVLVRLLADGSPVDPVVLALEMDREEGEVRASLAQLPGVERDERGCVTGLGLTLTATPYRLRVGDLSLFAWGAFETLLLPVLLGRSTRARFGEPGSRIECVVLPDGFEGALPASMRLGLVLPETAAVEADPRAAFSERAALLDGEGAASEFCERSAKHIVLDLPTAQAVARHLAQAVLARAGEDPA